MTTRPAHRAKRNQSTTAATGLALVGAVATTVANFVIAVLVAGASTELAGVFFSATAVATIAGNSSGLGTMTAQVYFMPRVLAAEAPDPRSLLMTALGPVAVAGIGTGLVLALVTTPLAAVVAPDRSDQAAAMLWVFALAVPCWALTVPLLGATRGLGTMTPTVVANQLVRPLGQVAGIAGLAASGHLNPRSLALAWALPVMAAALTAGVALWRLGGLAHGSGEPTVSRSEFWRYTRPRSAATAFQIALERSDVVLVGALAGEAAAGVYGALSRYITAGNFLIFSVAQATGPTLRRELTAGHLDRAQQLLARATAWMVLATWPYFLLVALKADTLTGLIDPAVVAGAGTLTVLAIAMLVNGATGPIDLTLLMLGRSGTSLAITATALAVDLGLGWLLIPRFGMVGAALAWGVAVVIVNGGATVAVERISGLRAVRQPALVAGAGALLAVVPIGLATPDRLVGLIATAAVAAVIGAAWAVRLAGPLGLPAVPVPKLRAALSRR